MGWLAASLIVPASAAYMLVVCCDRDSRGDRAALFFRLCLAIGLGIGLSSCTYFLWLFLGGPPGTTYLVCETAFFAVMGLLGLAGSRFPATPTVPSMAPEDAHGNRAAQSRWFRFLPIAYCAALIFAALGAVGVYRQAPIGDWDAWAIWNLRARCLYRAGENWRQAFAFVYEHTDYPLLVPGSNARLWSYYGNDCAWGPWLVGCLFTMATVGVLTAGIWRLRSRTQGLLAGMALLGVIPFLHCGALQYADVPLAFYILSAALLLALYDASEKPRKGLLILSGLAAGLGAWTKNEGLLFLVAVLAARCAALWLHGRSKKMLGELFLMILGALPALAVLAIQKVCLAANNDILCRQKPNALLMRLLDPSRYWCILKTILFYAMSSAKLLGIALLVCIVLLGLAKTRTCGMRGLPTACAAFFLMLGGYFMIYVITPQELNWHLATSATRLLLHLWPLFLLILFLRLATPEEVLLDESVSNN